MYTMEYYSAIKKKEIMSFSGKMDGTGDHYVKNNKPDSSRQISHIFFHM
jgi:hypothetical protein